MNMSAANVGSAALCLAILLSGMTVASAQPGNDLRLPLPGGVEAIAPALGRYGEDTLADGLWKRPGLPVRDHSIVTVAALIARDQPAELHGYFRLALDNGVKPSELSGVITHLAFGHYILYTPRAVR